MSPREPPPIKKASTKKTVRAENGRDPRQNFIDERFTPPQCSRICKKWGY
jgi:hypothetical protein